MEDVRLVRRVQQLLDEVVDRGLVGQIGEMHAQTVAQRADVVQRAAGGGAHEGMHVRVEMHECLRQVRAHEAVGPGDETRSAGEQPKGSPARGRSAVRSGVFTGLSYVALSGAAAVAGAFLAHKFGRNIQTDGFMAAYGVSVV